MGVVAGLFSIAVGLAMCFRRKEWGETMARRYIAYDAVWFFQFWYLLIGLIFVAGGVAQLFGWLR